MQTMKIRQERHRLVFKKNIQVLHFVREILHTSTPIITKLAPIYHINISNLFITLNV